ncbi:PFL family protein [Anaerococcus porci]|uniref:PFL family protein n=1 Tax=Anaerococcus porci TaxID=2652269 RepID=UPI002A761974|nr:PFL family protein [Anaerococcus porci]MDY3006582.1 PFL family protein [Anaerococcus porci]
MDTKQIIETIKMLDQEHLDIRTITMGINLLDCADSDYKKSTQKIYEKMMKECENFTETTKKVSEIYGVPIINNRISVTPISLVAASSALDDYTIYAEVLDKVAKDVGVDFVGGFSALVQKSMTKSDEILINSIPHALSTTDYVCSSVNVGSTRAGINLDAVKLIGERIKDLAKLTKDQDSLGCAKFVAFANAVEDNPFMAGSFLGVGEADTVINVGVSGPGVVKAAIEKDKKKPINEVYETIKKTAFKITRMGDLIGRDVAKRLGKEFGILDLSLAPTPAIGDSVGRILEEIGIEHVGGHGTTAALAMLNDAVKKGGLMASSSVGGLSGAFIPVSEDEAMIKAADAGHLTFDKLEAMTSVCSVGLDMIAIPGDTEASTISAMILDEAAIGVINQKTTAVRVIPVYGKKCGDYAEFGGLLGYAPIMDIRQSSSADFINRGGRIPAPVHSFKN